MNVLECKDKDGIDVVCSQETWLIHILDEHPEMNGYEAYVKTAIGDPYQIYQDSSNLNKRIIYKPFILPKPYNLQYLRVVIEYPRRKFGKARGFVHTAFPCLNIKKGDILLWQTQSITPAT